MSFTCQFCNLPQPPHSKPHKVVTEKYPNGTIKKEQDWCHECFATIPLDGVVVEEGYDCELLQKNFEIV